MAPDILLLILTLTSCLTEQVCCQMNAGSGDVETEANITDKWTSFPTHTVVTSLPQDSDITVSKEVGEESKAHGQIDSVRAATLMQTANKTHTESQNGTTGVKVKAVSESFGNATKNRTRGVSVNVEPSGNTTNNGSEVVPSQQEPTKNEFGEILTDDKDKWYSFIIITAVCVIVGLLLMSAVVAGMLIKHRRRKRKGADPAEEDPYLDDETEKVPMPMFEDDVPSVLELEMEDFEKWMIKGEGGVKMDSKQKQL